MEGSEHPNFMNPFEYGKSFLDKLFTKDLEPQPKPNPKYIGGGADMPPLVFKYAQIGYGK